MAQTERGSQGSDPVTVPTDSHDVLSDAVLRAIHEAAGDSSQTADVDAIDPLYETVDLDALDRLFRSSAAGESDRRTVSFVHDGYDVTVTVSGDVSVVAVE